LTDTRSVCPGVSPASARVTPSVFGFIIDPGSLDSGVWYAWVRAMSAKMTHSAGLKGHPWASPPSGKLSCVVPAHVATILSCPAVVFRIQFMKSSGAPSLRKAMSRLQSGTQSYALVASRKHTWVSVFVALLRCMTCVIMSKGACVFPPRINAYWDG
jgi:hypothetical protein